MSNDVKEALFVITAIIVCVVVVVGSLASLWWFLAIKIPSMRHEPLYQQLYNRCIDSSNYGNNEAAAKCADTLKQYKSQGAS